MEPETPKLKPSVPVSLNHQVDKNYEISLYGAVNVLVSLFASTVGLLDLICCLRVSPQDVLLS